ncbi:MAG: hypothetical protein PQJ46_00760 [Spirochaetales bacterium]|nr:hypothetical protein [Spirochaetales bacterium]
MKRLLIFQAIFFIVIALPLYSQSREDDTNSDGKTDRWVSLSGGHVTEVSLDKNFDGNIDYIVKYNKNGNKTEEHQDYNLDGKLDDFYFYSNGKMIRREIDSNYDEKVDIWVYLDGVYINKYEKDTDFDGEVDVVKDYTKE